MTLRPRTHLRSTTPQLVRAFLIALFALTAGQAVAQIGASASLPDFASLVRANSAAVVNISTDQVSPERALPDGFDPKDVPEGTPFDDFLKRFLEEQPQSEAKSLGSGFLISEDGYILTSAHVIADASRIIVRLADRREREATVIGADSKSDVALLKIEAEGLTAVNIGNPDDLEVGEWVLAIGSPFGFESSATAGIVSAKGRSLPNENYVPFIQTDVAINPGNSGGPLFNLDGEVIGVNAQIYSRTGGFMGLSFTVPIDLAMRVSNQLRDSGTVQRGWLGVAIQEVTPELAETFGMLVPRGALITEVLATGPAATSELRAGDVVVAFNDIPIETMAQLPPVVGQTAVGSVATVDVVRDTDPIRLEVRIGELPTDAQISESLAPQLAPEVQGDRSDDGSQSNRSAPATVPPAPGLGLSLESASVEALEPFGVEFGLKVAGVGTGAGLRAGVREDDILIGLNGQTFANEDEFKALVAELAPGKTAALYVIRGAQAMFLALK